MSEDIDIDDSVLELSVSVKKIRCPAPKRMPSLVTVVSTKPKAPAAAGGMVPSWIKSDGKEEPSHAVLRRPPATPSGSAKRAVHTTGGDSPIHKKTVQKFELAPWHQSNQDHEASHSASSSHQFSKNQPMSPAPVCHSKQKYK